MESIETQDALVRNVRNAMSVGGVPENGYPSAITQGALVESSGVSRASLTGQMLGGEEDINPKLKQICRVAEALGIPPAFLLMRPEDWTRLAQVVVYYGGLMRSSNPRVAELQTKFSHSSPEAPAEQALLAAHLARALGVDDQVSKETISESKNELGAKLAAKNADVKRRIFTSSSLLPLNHMQPVERFAALLLTTVFATHHRQERTGHSNNDE